MDKIKYCDDLNKFKILDSDTLVELVKLSYYWMEEQCQESIKDFFNLIPAELKNDFTNDFKMFRGMIRRSSEVYHKREICSWSTDKDIAESFREKESNFNMLSEDIEDEESDDSIIDSLFYKQDIGFDFTMFVLGIAEYIQSLEKSNNDLYEFLCGEFHESLGNEDINDFLEIFIRFKHEDEILSDFDVSNATILDEFETHVCAED